MPDLSSLPDPSQPSTTSRVSNTAADNSSAIDPIDAIGEDPFAAPDTEPEPDPFAAPQMPGDAGMTQVQTSYAGGAPTTSVSQTTQAGPASTQSSWPTEQPDYSAPEPIPNQAAQSMYVQPRQFASDAYELPDNLRPLGPLSYVGHTILYAIPVVGLIFLIIQSISKKNINRRNYARSCWIWLLIAVVVCAVLTLVGVIDVSVWERPIQFAQSLVDRF